jgi:hypothetical protein
MDDMEPKFEIRTTRPTLREAQEFVGGLVELLELPNGEQILCDEEGLLKDKFLNHNASRYVEDAFDATEPWVLVGNVILLRKEARWN